MSTTRKPPTKPKRDYRPSVSTGRITAEMRIRFGEALRNARYEASIRDPAFRNADHVSVLMPDGLRVSGSQIRNIEGGNTAPKYPQQVAALEQILGTAPGELAKHLNMPIVDVTAKSANPDVERLAAEVAELRADLRRLALAFDAYMASQRESAPSTPTSRAEQAARLRSPKQ